MNKTVWKSLAVRLIVGWGIVSVLPVALLSWRFSESANWDTSRFVSISASSFFCVATLMVLERFAKLPGQRSILMTLPVLLASAAFALVVLLVFHLPYSVYYFALSFPFAVVFFVISQFFLRTISSMRIAYVPLGRCLDLPAVRGVEWVSLKSSVSRVRNDFQAIVADFSDESLTNDWEKKLAETVLKGIPVYNVLQVREYLTGRLPIKHLYENNLGSLHPPPVYVLIKRLLSAVLIVASLPIVLPIMIVVAVIIKWESRDFSNAPVFFTQQRIGQGGCEFTMYKFRSMMPCSEKNGAKMAVIDDTRITRFGAFIRKSRLDELPQFFNVLKGDMSLIGPRPEQPSFVEQFNESIPFYSYRHIVKPGISGWAQVMQGYTSDEDETKVKLEYDFYYIKNFSLTLDLLIVIRTFLTMLTGFGAR